MNSDDENQVVLDAIKEAHNNPFCLLREETITLVSRLPYMGFPKPLPAKARGRKPIRTQYDAAFDRRKNLYRKLVKLPQSRIKAADARRKIGDPLRELVLQLANEFAPTTPRYRLAGTILRFLHEHPRLLQPDIKSVRAILNKSYKSMR